MRRLSVRHKLNEIQTHMAANRGDGIGSAIGKTWGRGGVFGCEYQKTAIILLDLHTD